MVTIALKEKKYHLPSQDRFVPWASQAASLCSEFFHRDIAGDNPPPDKLQLLQPDLHCGNLRIQRRLDTWYRKGVLIESTIILEAFQWATANVDNEPNKNIYSRALYRTLIEAMSNTLTHAGSTNQWNMQMSKEVDCNGLKVLRCVFFDFGDGLISSLSRKLKSASPKDLHSVQSLIFDTIFSASENYFSQAYRGQGLKAMRQDAENDILQNFIIVTNNIWLSLKHELVEQMPDNLSFPGTLLSWSVPMGSF